jgi:hypothetical protein
MNPYNYGTYENDRKLEYLQYTKINNKPQILPINICVLCSLISIFTVAFSSLIYTLATVNLFHSLSNTTELYSNVVLQDNTLGFSSQPTMMGAFIPGMIPSPTQKPSFKPTNSNKNKDDSIKFTTNRYGYGPLQYFLSDASEIYKYVFLEDYVGVIEPYADMQVNITNDSTGESYYKYIICDETTSSCVNGINEETTFSFSCTPHISSYSVVVEQYSKTTGKSSGLLTEGRLLCMYVRREFNSLTEDDLEKTMEAMWKLWDLDDEEGQKIYGDDFHSYSYLLDFHYFNAGWIHSDHIHEGNGFAAQHIKMSNIFEVSMQAVDPSVTLPYWDYTIETANNIAIWDSPVFTKDTFGSLPLPNNYTWGWLYSENDIDDGRIPDGRWENLEVEKNTKFDNLYYAYGYMRAPWNVNPSKYVSRYTSIDKTLPTCKSHYSLLEYDDIVDFFHTWEAILLARF